MDKPRSLRGIRLGRPFGIETRLHWSFVVLVGALLLFGSVGASPLQAFRSVGLLLTIFGCVLLHEFGHALAARRYGIATRDIVLLPIGGIARLDRIPREPKQELVIAAAGPLVNVVIAASLAVVSFLVWTPFLQTLLQVNVTLVLFNLLPAFPMDGGRMLRAALASRTDPARATRTAARIGRGFAMLFAFAGFVYNPFLLFIAAFVWMAGQQEAAYVEERELLGSRRVREVMQNRFLTLDATQSVGEALSMSLQSGQSLFPVHRDGRWIGVFDASDVRSAGADELSVAVGNRVGRDGVVVAPDQVLSEAASALRSRRASAALVIDSDRAVGIVGRSAIERCLVLARSGRRGATDFVPEATLSRPDPA